MAYRHAEFDEYGPLRAAEDEAGYGEDENIRGIDPGESGDDEEFDEEFDDEETSEDEDDGSF